MKTGMKKMLGLGFLAALAGLAKKSKGDLSNIPLGNAGMRGSFNHGNPVWFGKSQRTRKSNRNRLTANARLKRRRG